MNKKLTEIFGEPISVYTDDKAVEDGVLVTVNAHDRVTRAVFDWMTETAPEGPQPPDRWPVEIMRWFRATDAETKAVALSEGLIGTHGAQARHVYEQNIGGGIWKAQALVKGGVIQGLHVRGGGKGQSGEALKDLWLLPNEWGGMTLMFPENY